MEVTPKYQPFKNPQTHQNSTHQSRSNLSRLHSRSNFSRLLIGPDGVISRFHVARGFNQIHSFLRHCGGGKIKLETSFREATCGTLVGPRKRSRWKEAEHGETAGHRFKPWPPNHSMKTTSIQWSKQKASLRCDHYSPDFKFYMRYFCWWKKSKQPPGMVQDNPVNNGIKYQPQLVSLPDVSHQQ